MNTLPLSLRQRKILHLLQNQTSFVTSREIAGKLNVSSRTIRNEIVKMNQLLVFFQVRIHSIQSKGFLLEAENPEELRRLSRVDTAFLSREERIRYLAFRLCQSEHPINLYDLEEEIFVSRSTLMYDLRGLKQRFSYVPPFLRVVIKRDEISLQTKEKTIRQVLLNLFHRDWDYHTAGTLYFGTRFLDEELLSALQEEAPDILFRQGLILDDPTLAALILSLAIMHHRYYEGHTLPESSDRQEYPPSILQATEELFSLMAEKTELKLYPEPEKEDIRRFLRNSGLYLDDWKLSDSVRYSKKTDLKEEISRFLAKVSSIYHVDFSDDAEFIEALRVFLHQVLSGSSLFTHPQVAEIKEHLSAEFELAMIYQQMAQEYIGRFLTEDELCSLAICFSGAIRNYLAVHPHKKLKTVLFCHSNIAEAWAMKRKILESFDLYLEITHILPLSNQEYFNYEETELILVMGNRKLAVHKGICTVMIDEHPLSEFGESAMNIKLQSFRNIWPVPSFSLQAMLEEAFWHELSDAGDPYQVMEEMGKDFIQAGLASENHLLDMTRRETRSSFAFKPGIVFLFTIIPSKETRLSVTTLRHRIRWNDYRVGTIIMAMFTEEERNLLFHLKILFYSRAVDPDELQALKKKEELIPYLCSL